MEQIPLWWAPNAITFTGLASVVATTTVLMLSSPNGTDPVCDYSPFAGFKKAFFKAQPSGFLGFYWVLGLCWVFLDKQEKIGKIIQKLSNLKP